MCDLIQMRMLLVVFVYKIYDPWPYDFMNFPNNFAVSDVFLAVELIFTRNLYIEVSERIFGRIIPQNVISGVSEMKQFGNDSSSSAVDVLLESIISLFCRFPFVH